MKPFFGIIYGPSGVGKTLSCLRAFPEGHFIGPEGSTLSASYLGLEQVNHTVPRNIDSICVALEPKRLKGRRAVIIEDLSLLADAELDRCKQREKGWGAFDLFNAQIYKLRDASRKASAVCPVVWSMHQQNPKTVTNKETGNSKPLPGCPLIPGWQLPEKIPAMADFVAHVVRDDSSLGWPYMMTTMPDEEWVAKDRLNIGPKTFPLNLRCLLLGAGYDLPRPEGLEWLDQVVDKAAQKLKGIIEKRDQEAMQAYLQGIAKQLIDKYNPKHVRWALMDALDAASLSIHQDNIITDFISTTTYNIGDKDDLVI